MANGAIDCVLRGEGEISTPLLLAAVSDGGIAQVPGPSAARGAGRPRNSFDDLDRFPPARDLVRRRRHYFIGELDPCASIEFTRGCHGTAHSAAPGRSMAALTASRARRQRLPISPPSRNPPFYR